MWMARVRVTSSYPYDAHLSLLPVLSNMYISHLLACVNIAYV